MAPIPQQPGPSDPGSAADAMMPDLSHLSEEERRIILGVMQRHTAEKQKEEEIAQKGDRELRDIERQIQERKEVAQRLIGTQDDAICQICQKTKFADGIGHKCFYCQLRSCARCGGRTTSKNKTIWACSLCQKRQQILAKTGKWFQEAGAGQLAEKQTTPTASPCTATAPLGRQLSDQPPQRRSSVSSGDQRRQSLSERHQQQMQTDSALKRQGTLHRQSSVEDQHGQLTLNGGQRGTMPLSASTEEQLAASTNGQMQRKSTGAGQQTAEQQMQMERDRERQMAAAAMEQQQPKQSYALTAEEQQLRPTNSARSAAAARPSSGGQLQEPIGVRGRQRSMEEAQHSARQSPKTSAARAVPSSSAGSTAGVGPVPAAVPPPDSSTTMASTMMAASRQSSTAGVAPSPMRRRTKTAANHHRQQQQQQLAVCSSSSDDEMSSPKPSGTSMPKQSTAHQQPQPAVLPLQSNSLNTARTGGAETDFSEKELLRYIYDNAHPSAKKAAAASARAPGAPFFVHTHSLDLSMSAATAAQAPTPAATTSSPPSNALARRIRNYLSNPAVSWQPSADQRRLIGHIVLHKPSALSGAANSSAASSLAHSSLDFGVKVVGGRNPANGRLGAFVSRVRPGSVADTVGQLRAGDEVLEWNGHSLQNVTPETVYNIVQSTKGDTRLELIVSRPLPADGDDFLNVRRRVRDQQQQGGALPHSQSLTAASPFGTPQQRFSRRAPSPLVLHNAAAARAASMGSYFDPMASASRPPTLPETGSPAEGQRVCGRVELSLLYLGQKRELIISLNRAAELQLRPDGSLRNPYVKLFLLPDRSERSRRQSKVCSESLAPVWSEHFFYEELDERQLAARVLEVTVWDFDPFESHCFLGETLIELANAPLNNQSFAYFLTDMDDDNPIRMRLRQRRYSSLTPPMGHRSRSQMSYPAQKHSFARSHEGRDEYWEAEERGWNNSHSVHNIPYYVSRAGGGSFPSAIADDAFWPTAEEDWTRNGYTGDEEQLYWHRQDGAKQRRRVPNGYLSDHEVEWGGGETERRRREHHRQRHRHQHHRGGERGAQRRPQSASALRNIAQWELRHGAGPGPQQSAAAANYYEQEDGEPPGARRQAKRTTRHQELREQEAAGGGGYGSDGSVETLMSVNSAQSMQNKAILRQQQMQRLREQQETMQTSSMEDNTDGLRGVAGAGGGSLVAVGAEEDMYGTGGEEQLMAGDGRMGGGGGVSQHKMTMKEMKERKKSLMTRLIPGRNGPSDANKRLGFARSEEVGIPDALAPPEQNREFIKQNSKESTDSSDNWLPIRPDRPLGSFVENLGPGQVVGRQALGSTPLGELQATLAVEQGTGLVVDVLQAKGLTALRQGIKAAPAVYVKAYLMEGKNCLAKAKTQSTKTKSASPQFRQKLLFAESPRHKMLQLTVLADYGRIERKSFLGVAQIALDELQLQLQTGREPVLGWFKLFQSSSLNGSGVQPPPANGSGQGPSRKDSEVSLN